MNNKSKSRPKLNDAYLNQISVLRGFVPVGVEAQANKQLLINQITVNSGLKDEREVQRCLYILEGQKLVSPHPAGDFTSKIWHITNDGVRALKMIAQSNAA